MENSNFVFASGYSSFFVDMYFSQVDSITVFEEINEKYYYYFLIGSEIKKKKIFRAITTFLCGFLLSQHCDALAYGNAPSDMHLQSLCVCAYVFMIAGGNEDGLILGILALDPPSTFPPNPHNL